MDANQFIILMNHMLSMIQRLEKRIEVIEQKQNKGSQDVK